MAGIEKENSVMTLDVGTKKFNFTDIVNKLVLRINREKKVTDGTEKPVRRIFKTRDKWIRLTAQLPQAVALCMSGRNYDEEFVCLIGISIPSG